MEVTVQKTSGNTRTYEFDQDISSTDLSWLDSTTQVESYEVKGSTLRITKTASADWMTLESTSIIPSLKKTFDGLKVKEYASR